MEIRQLTYFVAVAEELHFRGAAARLHVAQPAVSEQIRKLEAELGVELFVRAARSIALTAAGTGLLLDARQILRSTASAARSARAAADTEGTRLRLGYTPFGLPPGAASVLAEMRRGAVPVTLELTCDDARSLVSDVRVGQLDAAVVHVPAPTAGLQTFDAGGFRAHAVVVRSAGNDRDRLELDQLQRMPIVLMPREIDPAFHDAVKGALSHAGLAADTPVSTARSVKQLMIEVASGGGAAIVPGLTEVGEMPDELAVREIGLGAPTVTLGLVVRLEPPSAPLAAAIDGLSRLHQARVRRERDGQTALALA